MSTNEQSEKVEFKQGDWVVTDEFTIGRVKCVNDDTVTVVSSWDLGETDGGVEFNPKNTVPSFDLHASRLTHASVRELAVANSVMEFMLKELQQKAKRDALRLATVGDIIARIVAIPPEASDADFIEKLNQLAVEVGAAFGLEGITSLESLRANFAGKVLGSPLAEVLSFVKHLPLSLNQVHALLLGSREEAEAVILLSRKASVRYVTEERLSEFVNLATGWNKSQWEMTKNILDVLQNMTRRAA